MTVMTRRVSSRAMSPISAALRVELRRPGSRGCRGGQPRSGTRRRVPASHLGWGVAGRVRCRVHARVSAAAPPRGRDAASARPADNRCRAVPQSGSASAEKGPGRGSGQTGCQISDPYTWAVTNASPKPTRAPCSTSLGTVLELRSAKKNKRTMKPTHTTPTRGDQVRVPPVHPDIPSLTVHDRPPTLPGRRDSPTVPRRAECLVLRDGPTSQEVCDGDQPGGVDQRDGRRPRRALLPLKWLAGRRARSIRASAFDMPSTGGNHREGALGSRV
jgi:hypothetical protein